jgi:hypothetical protein
VAVRPVLPEPVAVRPVLPEPLAPLASAELQLLAVLPQPQKEPRDQTEPPACQASRLGAFRPKQKGKRKVQQE